MKTIEKIESKQKVETYLNLKFEHEIEYVKMYFSIMKNNKADKIFKISQFRDRSINGIVFKKEKYLNKIQKEKSKLEFKLKNNELSNFQFKNESKKLDESKKLEKFLTNNEKVKQKKLEKWNKLIEKNAKFNKKVIAKIELKEKNKLENILLKKNKMLLKINEENSNFEKFTNLNFQKRLNKFNNSKIVREIENINKLNLESKIGPLDFQSKIKALEIQKNKIVEKSNNLKNDSMFLKYKHKIDIINLFNFSNKVTIKNNSLDLLKKFKLVIFIMLFTTIIGIIEPLFFTSRNWINILSQKADLGCFAIGVTIIILTGGIDLSMGSALAFSTALAAKMIAAGNSIILVLIVMGVFAILAGLISGVLVGYFKLPPFIVTLVLMLVWRGATYVHLENKIIPFENDFLNNLTQIKFLNLPLTVYIMFALAFVMIVIMKMTKYGRSIYAIGGNYKASELSGIRSKLILCSAYIVGSFCMVFGSIIYMARVKVATPSTGNAWELDAIACVVLGGTALTGGKGGILQTLIGWFVISILTNSLVIVGIDTNIQFILKGVVILVAILSDVRLNVIGKIKNNINYMYYRFRTV